MEKSFILLEDISSPFDVPEEKVAGDRGENSPVGRPEGRLEDVCETEVGTKADVGDKNVDTVGGVDEDGASGYRSEGFTLAEVSRKKRLFKRRVFECVNVTSHLENCAKAMEKLLNGRLVSMHQSVKICEQLLRKSILLYSYEISFFWRLQT